MSVKVSTWVWHQSEAGGNDLLVLLALADQANDDGVCWPSVKYIAEKTRISESTVKRRLLALEAAGVIEIESRSGTSNRYKFTFETGVGQFDLGHQGDLGGRSPSDLGGRSPSDLLNVNEPSMKRHLSKATQFPDDFVWDDVVAWTRASGLSVDADDFAQFRDYHLSRGATRKDWRASWQTWARNSRKFGNTAGATGRRNADRKTFDGIRLAERLAKQEIQQLKVIEG